MRPVRSRLAVPGVSHGSRPCPVQSRALTAARLRNSRTSRFTRAFAVSACVGPSGQGWAEDVAWGSDAKVSQLKLRRGRRRLSHVPTSRRPARSKRERAGLLSVPPKSWK